MRGNDEAAMLRAAAPLIDAGIAVHWLKRESKRPVEDGWQTAPVHTFDTLKAAYRRGYNMGVRPGEFSQTPYGYLHLIDMDIRDPLQAHDAWAVLDRVWPEWRDAPYVISGSGGESRHVYLFIEKPFRSAKLAHSTGFSMVYDHKLGRDVKKYDWEVELFGAPKQAVLPPSIHPDTGRAYEWGREIDWSALVFGDGPILSAETVEGWGARADGDPFGEDDEFGDLLREVKWQPMGLSDAEVDQVLADLPVEWVEDHDLWVMVGMALAHEYEGSQVGFEKWCQWARQSSKFDLKDSTYRWKRSFGKRQDKDPVRMPTLIKAAGEARDQREWADWEDDGFENLASVDVLDDLLGDAEGKSLVVINTDVDPLDDLLGDPVRPSPPPYRKVKDDFDPEWETYLERNKDGDIKGTLHNIELLVRNDKRTRGTIAYNEFAESPVLIKNPALRGPRKTGAKKPARNLTGPLWEVKDRVNGTIWIEDHDYDLRMVMEAPKSQGGYQIKITDRDLRGAVSVIGRRNGFHPIREYLHSLSWDGRSRVETLFIDYLGAADTPFHREAALMFMLGAVTRVMEPGHKFDYVPILKGAQGKRKSTFVNILARNWFGELDGDVRDKKAMVEAMQGCWVMELPELSAFTRAEVNILKAFVTRTGDKVRMAYGRRAGYFMRQCVFIGTTNEEWPLTDPSGNRRFWMIVCDTEEIDTNRLAGEVDQLWAEALAMYYEWRKRHPDGSLPLYLKNADAIEEARRLQEDNRRERPEDQIISAILEWVDEPIDDGLTDLEDGPPEYRQEISAIQVWVEMKGRDRHDFPYRDQLEINNALAKLPGWTRGVTKRVPKYGPQRVYTRD